ncbi:MAG: O-antigen translocase [Sulfurovum sp.]|nr:MAG: O-antigen translocase [Sulfurovum sp.]
MTIKSTFILTSIHTVIKILSGIVMNKIIAVYLGPSGLAMLGQFQNFASVASSVSNGSIQTGLLTQTARHNTDEQRKVVWANGLILSFVFTLLTSLFIFIFASWLSQHVFFTTGYINLLYIFSYSLIFYSLNLFIISIVNGLGNIKLYTIINILISIFSLILVSLLTILFQFEGAILGIILTQSLVFVISYLIIYKYYKNSFFVVDISMLDKSIIKTLLSYGLTSFSSGLIVAVTYMAVRAIIVSETSLEDAGLWEAAIKIGLYFNMLFALPISIYYLPKFSALNTKEEVFLLLKQAILFVTPIMFLSMLLFFIFKDFFISTLFSNSFLLISGFIVIVLLAEIFRVTVILFSNLLLSKKKFNQIIFYEFLMGVVFVLYTYLFYKEYELFGLSIGYLFISGIMMIIYGFTVLNFCNKIFEEEK